MYMEWENCCLLYTSIQKYKEEFQAKHVQILFITRELPVMDQLIAQGKKVDEITNAFDHILKNIILDCDLCPLHPICDDVEAVSYTHLDVYKRQIKNRVVMGPMGNLNMCEESGRPNDKMLQYFFARAKGGTGLLTTGLIPVSHGIDPTVTEVDDLSLFPRIDHARTVFAGWRDLTQGVHAYGSKIFIQITPRCV